MNETLNDLAEDISSQAELFESGVQRLATFCSRYDAIASSAHPEAKQYIFEQARLLQTHFSQQALARRTRLVQQPTWASDDVDSLLALKREGIGWLRTLYGELGSVLVSSDWQSPSFLHALKNHAGTQAGKIIGTMNDYKRDGHMDAQEFEIVFCKQYIDAPLQLPPHACVTSSGMSAFATLLTHLACDKQLRGPILAGSGSYFQNKILLEKFFPDQIEYVDETDTKGVVARAKELRPHAVFLDTLCNDIQLAVPDLHSLVPRLLRVLPSTAALVLDNSALSVSCQPLAYNPKLGIHATIYVVESLNKYVQFGLDRVMGGIIWNSGGIKIEIKNMRKHLGTILPDASVLSIPTPNRMLLNKRLARFHRNATWLAERLNQYLQEHPNRFVSHITYPNAGSFFVITFHPNQTDLSVYQRFISRAIDEAQKNNIELLSSTSFGFDTTRLYTTAVHATRFAKPFVRVSVGTETMQEIETLERIFAFAIESL